jgi:hypothetical protein
MCACQKTFPAALVAAAFGAMVAAIAVVLFIDFRKHRQKKGSEALV